jgi:tRNA modification GTPase
VGKSTLLNRLAGREAAITSEIAGTTRDVIEVKMDLDGLPVTLLDTAGLRETNDVVESIGIERAISRARSADLRVVLREIGKESPIELESGDIIVDAKADLNGGVGVSGATGQGVDDLIAQITDILRSRVGTIGVAMRERHRIAMLQAIDYLDSVQVALENGGFMEDLVAEDIRSAGRSIDSLLGRIDVEDILGEIFSSFCIGK